MAKIVRIKVAVGRLWHVFCFLSRSRRARTAPEIQAASSDARKRAAPATSSGSPTRPSGYHLATRSRIPGSFLPVVVPRPVF